MLRTSTLEEFSSSRSENEKKMVENHHLEHLQITLFFGPLGFFPGFCEAGGHVLPPERDRDSEGINKVSRATAIASFF